MAEAKQRGNLRATLALSREEARTGTERLITLSSGQKVNLFVYPGAYNGQKIHLSGRGERAIDGTSGDLIVTLMVPEADSLQDYPFVSNESDAAMNAIYLTPSSYSSVKPSLSTNNASSAYSPTYSTKHQSPIKSQYTSLLKRFPKSHLSYFSPTSLFTRSSQHQPFASSQRSLFVNVLTAILIVMLLFGGGLVLYTTIYIPHKDSSDAAATAVARANRMEQANATAFAQQAATAAAIGHATAIALAQLQNDYLVTTASTPYLSDPLQTPYLAGWDVNSNCGFSGGAYYVTSASQKTIALCLATNIHLTNFAFQVHMNILKGDGGGIVFRANASTSQNYLLKVSSDGSFELDYYPDQTGKTAQTLASDSSTLLKTGLNQNNTICVIARGNTMSFYFNGQYATTVKDSSLAGGSIGVTADDDTNATDVAYTQAQIWQL